MAALAVINAAGVYALLVAAHVGERGGPALETQDGMLAARIELQAHTVADLNRRLGQIEPQQRPKIRAQPEACRSTGKESLA
jgi:hypothetical protein